MAAVHRQTGQGAFAILRVGLTLALLASVPLGATVTVPAELREIVSDAQLILRGRVTDVRAFEVRGEGIATVATVMVEAVFKGRADGFVSVRVPGGQIGRYRFVMVDAPTFTVNERAEFLLARAADNTWRPVGLSMGICPIHTEPATGRAVVDPPVLLGTTASTGPIVRGDARRTLMAVADFEAIVRLIVAARPGAAGRTP